MYSCNDNNNIITIFSNDVGLLKSLHIVLVSYCWNKGTLLDVFFFLLYCLYRSNENGNTAGFLDSVHYVSMHCICLLYTSVGVGPVALLQYNIHNKIKHKYKYSLIPVSYTHLDVYKRQRIWFGDHKINKILHY